MHNYAVELFLLRQEGWERVFMHIGVHSRPLAVGDFAVGGGGSTPGLRVPQVCITCRSPRRYSSKRWCTNLSKRGSDPNPHKNALTTSVADSPTQGQHKAAANKQIRLVVLNDACTQYARSCGDIHTTCSSLPALGSLTLGERMNINE